MHNVVEEAFSVFQDRLSVRTAEKPREKAIKGNLKLRAKYGLSKLFST
jgi:hypothetical protein